MKTKKRFLGATLALLLVGVMAFSGCEIPIFHQTVEANKKADEVKAVFAEVDTATKGAFTLSQEVKDDALTNSVMKNNLDEVEKKTEELDEVKVKLEKTSATLNSAKSLRLSAKYQNYIKALDEARAKRLEALNAAQDLLFESENLSSAIVKYYSAINRLEQVATKMGEMPEVTFDNPDTIKQAKTILGEVSVGTKETQTEFNEAATAVNAEVFTKLRDTAADLGNMADAADKLVTIYESLLTAAINGDEQGFVNAYNQLPVQLEILVASLEKFGNSFPYDLIDNNNDLTTKAQNQIETWKDENFKDPTSQYQESETGVTEADKKAADIKK
ncbi:hypothetical protein KKC60_02260 [Patescibacteria group bacterium]|nr:hypothetical protein [Patescibacteria group bacterium]